MATDATGTPTSLGIPKYNTSSDPPSGKGFNAAMDALDALLLARINAPVGIATGEAPVWNGTTFARSSVTKLGNSSLSGYPWVNADISAAAAIGISKLAGYPSDATKVLLGDGTWATMVTTPVIERRTATVDIVSSVAELSMYDGSAAGAGTGWLISAGLLGTNKTIKLRIIGDWTHNAGGADTLTFRVKFGGTTFYANALFNTGSASANRHPFEIEVLVSNLGATNSQEIFGHLFATDVAEGTPTTGIGAFPMTGTTLRGGLFASNGLGTIDTTAAVRLDVTGQWSASAAGNSWRVRHALLELL